MKLIKQSLSNNAQNYLNQREETTIIKSKDILDVWDESGYIETLANGTQKDVNLIEESVVSVLSLLHNYKVGENFVWEGLVKY